MDALAERSAANADPLKLTLIESLLRRAVEARPAVAAHLVGRANGHLLALENRDVADTKASIQSLSESWKAEWQALLQDMQPQTQVDEDESSLDRQYREQEQVLLASLGVESAALRAAAAEPSDEKAPFPQLKAAQKLRIAKVRQHQRQRVSRALEAQPESPGPLNPQMLAIKALAQMQTLSPHYLERFVSYLDTLLLLAQSEGESVSAKSGKKASPSRRRPSRKK